MHLIHTQLFHERSELSWSFKHRCVCVSLSGKCLMALRRIQKEPQDRSRIHPPTVRLRLLVTSCSLGRRSCRVRRTRRTVVVCFLLVNSNVAICLDIVKDLELCTHDIQGVAVHFLVIDRPAPVSFVVPEIARALLKDKWKHDTTARE